MEKTDEKRYCPPHKYMRPPVGDGGMGLGVGMGSRGGGGAEVCVG